jgi:hypothetical protein
LRIFRSYWNNRQGMLSCEVSNLVCLLVAAAPSCC